MPSHKSNRNRAVRTGVLVGCALALGAATTAAADSATRARGVDLIQGLIAYLERPLLRQCLTPSAGEALAELVGRGELEAVLGGDFVLVRGNVRTDQIEVEIGDRGQRSYGVTLALPGAKSGRPNGEGRRFLFYLTASPGLPNQRAREVLLSVAELFDRAIPESAVELCMEGERRYPRALILASAALEISVVLAALAFGLLAIPSTGERLDL